MTKSRNKTKKKKHNGFLLYKEHSVRDYDENIT